MRDSPVRALSVILLLPIVVLSGCFMGSGNEEPISVTLRDGEYVFHWCGDATEEYKYLQIKFAEYAPDRVDGDAFRGAGLFSLNAGDEFTVSSPPSGVAPSVQNRIPESENALQLFLRTGSSEDELDGIRAIYRIDRPSDLQDRWLYPSGSIEDEPCAMRGATGGG